MTRLIFCDFEETVKTEILNSHYRQIYIPCRHILCFPRSSSNLYQIYTLRDMLHISDLRIFHDTIFCDFEKNPVETEILNSYCRQINIPCRHILWFPRSSISFFQIYTIRDLLHILDFKIFHDVIFCGLQKQHQFLSNLQYTGLVTYFVWVLFVRFVNSIRFHIFDVSLFKVSVATERYVGCYKNSWIWD